MLKSGEDGLIGPGSNNYGAEEKAPIAKEVKVPTCGRIVHYFPNKADAHCAANGAVMVPAIVVQDWNNLIVNLSVFPMNPDGTNVLRYSVHHISEAPNNGGLPIGAYWAWPEMK